MTGERRFTRADAKAMTARVLARLALGGVLLAVHATNAACQASDSSASIAHGLTRAQSANQMVRLRSVSGAESVGRIAAVADSTVRIGRQTLRFFDQQSLEVRLTHADPLWDGAAIGTLVNLAVSFPLIMTFPNMCECTVGRRERATIVIGSALFGLLAGGAIDAARERPPEWRLAWKRGS